MIRNLFHRCATPAGALADEDQAAVDAFRAMLAALRHPEPWRPGCAHDIAVRVGPFIERAQTRPGDDHGPDIIAVALQHPGRQYTHYGEHYRKIGWLRCETTKMLGLWHPSYALLSLDLPDDVGMPPAHYAVYVEARRADPRQGFTLLRLGPYTQAQDASWDADRIDAALVGRATTVRPRFKVAARRARSPSATTSSSPTRTRPTSSRSWPPPYQGRPPEGQLRTGCPFRRRFRAHEPAGHPGPPATLPHPR
ncbi:hypothetical protein OG379_00180 [Streptomyces sp. NBC_01166]|uniref:hypothetical protein n=1 Tax=Streptomyces sp. NBC_01166 TaxID=2903755 RepID=UPI00386F07D6|nr:hypothetical protein OG379_00180 [Streptomyces sp. NBC_01166]